MPDQNDLHIADSLRTLGKYELASDYYARVIISSEAARDWSLYVRALTGECANQTEWGNPGKAIESGKKATEVGTRELGEKNLDVAFAQYVTAYAYTQAGDLADAGLHFEKCLSTMKGLLDENDLKIAEVYEGYSEYFSERGDYDRQIELLQHALTIRRRHGGDSLPELAITYSNLGLAYQDKGYHRKAAGFLSMAVEHQVRTIGENHPQTALMYNNLGMSYFYGGDNDRAVENYKKSLSIYSTIGGNNPRAAFAHNNIAMAFRQTKDYKGALEHGAKARDIFTSSLGGDHPNVTAIINNLGRTYFDMGNYRKAEDAFRLALNAWRAKLGDNHPNIGQSYYNLSEVALKRKRYTLAHARLDTSLTIRRTALGERHPKVAEALKAQGSIYAQQQRYDEALSCYQQALIILTEGFTDTNVHVNPTLDQVDPRVSLLGVLSAKADALQRRSGKLEDLKASADAYSLAAKLIDKLRRGFSTEGAKLYLSSESFGVLEKGIGIALKLHDQTGHDPYKEMAFEFAERGKSGMLAEALAEADARRFPGIPDSLLEREQTLRDDLVHLDTRCGSSRRRRSVIRRSSTSPN
jgi:tetratricopeptide (TPR) repeat protein